MFEEIVGFLKIVIGYVVFIFVLAILAMVCKWAWHLVDQARRKSIVEKLNSHGRPLLGVAVYSCFLVAGAKICWDLFREHNSDSADSVLGLCIRGFFGLFAVAFGATFLYQTLSRWKRGWV